MNEVAIRQVIERWTAAINSRPTDLLLNPALRGACAGVPHSVGGALKWSWQH
jgi:hypothetical protein